MSIKGYDTIPKSTKLQHLHQMQSVYSTTLADWAKIYLWHRYNTKRFRVDLRVMPIKRYETIPKSTKLHHPHQMHSVYSTTVADWAKIYLWHRYNTKRFRVDLRVMPIKRYDTIPKSTKLQHPHQMQSVYSTTVADWAKIYLWHRYNTKRFRVDLRVMPIKRYDTIPKSTKLQHPHQMHSVYSTTLADWAKIYLWHRYNTKRFRVDLRVMPIKRYETIPKSTKLHHPHQMHSVYSTTVADWAKIYLWHRYNTKRFRVDLRVMPIKRYDTIPKSTKLQHPHQMHSVYSTTLADWAKIYLWHRYNTKRFRVDLRVMPIKRYDTIPKSTKLQHPHQMQSVYFTALVNCAMIYLRHG